MYIQVCRLSKKAHLYSYSNKPNTFKVKNTHGLHGSPDTYEFLSCFDLQEFSGRVKGLKVDPVDTTGAGDAFVAGILSQFASDTLLLQVILILDIS